MTDNNTSTTTEKQGQVSTSLPAPIIPATDTTSLIDKAYSVVKRIEEANKKAEELLIRQELAAARIMLGGKAEAGINIPEKTEEDKKKEQMKEYFKGCAIEKMLK